MLSPSFLVVAASACLHSAAASSVYTDSNVGYLETRQAADCTNTRAASSTACWDILDLSDYLAGWGRTTPTCEASGGDAADCCQPAEPWSTCFLRLAYGRPGSDCTQLQIQGCTLGLLNPNLDPSIVSQVRYVVQSIVIINSLFVSYYQALQTGMDASDLQAKLAQILQDTNPPQQDVDPISVVLKNGNVLKAWLAGLPFWATPPVIASGPQQIRPSVNSAAAQAFAESIQNTEAVRSIMFGAPYNSKGSVDPATGSTGDTAILESLLFSALSLIMSDISTFTSWAAHGLYADPTLLDISLAAPGTTSAFTTYLVSESLSQSHFSATLTTAVAKHAFQNGRTCTPLGDVCKDSGNQTYYWSGANQVQYHINEPSKWPSANGTLALEQLGYEGNAYGLLGYIEVSNAYMPVLFDGAYNCTLEGKARGSAVNVNTDGSLDIACLSSLPIYLTKGSSCPAGAVKVGGKCPFGFI